MQLAFPSDTLAGTTPQSWDLGYTSNTHEQLRSSHTYSQPRLPGLARAQLFTVNTWLCASTSKVITVQSSSLRVAVPIYIFWSPQHSCMVKPAIGQNTNSAWKVDFAQRPFFFPGRCGSSLDTKPVWLTRRTCMGSRPVCFVDCSCTIITKTCWWSILICTCTQPCI